MSFFPGMVDFNLPHYIISCFRKGAVNIMNLGRIQEALNTREINRKKKRYSNEKKKHVLETIGLKQKMQAGRIFF